MNEQQQQDFGFNQNQQGFGMDFNNMNNAFNPMMGMPNGMMGNFGMMPNMMGKSQPHVQSFQHRSRLRVRQGMMDPSAMFNSGFGGFGGMNDMNMMNMGMGMGGMNGMNGMNGFGGMQGMGGGPGFFQGNGYNNQQQQSFGNHMNPNFNHNRGYGGRGFNRGFGRGGRGFYGGRGRGGWQNQNQFGHQQNFMNQNQPFQQQNFNQQQDSIDTSAQQGARRGSPSYEPMSAAADESKAADSPTLTADAEHTNEARDATNQTDTATVDGNAGVEAMKSPDAGDANGKSTSSCCTIPLFAHALAEHYNFAETLAKTCI